jgi:hypothetical protein
VFANKIVTEVAKMKKITLLSLVASAMILTAVSCRATPEPEPEAPAPVLAARDAALTYIRGHYEDAPAESLSWTEELMTPEDLPGGRIWQYTAEDWVVTISYAVSEPEWLVYWVAVANPSTGLEWEGRVDGSGHVPEAPEYALGARDAAMRYVTEEYDQPGLGAGLAWEEEPVTPVDMPGGEAYRYTAGDWVVTISYASVPPEQAVYPVSVVNQATGFEWEGEVDAEREITQVRAPAPEVMLDRIAARDAALDYIYEHHQYSPSESEFWQEERIAPDDIEGTETYRYTPSDWIVEISYRAGDAEAMVYEVTVTNPDLGLEWYGEVDAWGRVTELGAQTPETMHDPTGARDAAMNYICETYKYPPVDTTAVEWEEEDITPEGLAGWAAFRYTVDSWVVEVSHPIVPPEATIYMVAVSNPDLDFEWHGTVDPQGVVTEGAQRPDVSTASDEVSVESIDILILESFPVQVHVVAKGHLPDACIEIDQITQQLQGNTFTVAIGTARLPDARCAPAAVPFEEVIPLEVWGLPAGTYSVDVNGVTGSFELEMDNVLPED